MSGHVLFNPASVLVAALIATVLVATGFDLGPEDPVPLIADRMFASGPVR